MRKDDEFLTGGGEMGKLVGAIDWSRTPLGPIESWPQSLRTAVSLCLASNFPISMVWGAGRVQIYNDGYWPICGDKHPRSMGQDFKECWWSAWPVIGPAFDQAAAGRSAFLENQRIFIDRYGYLEETFFTFSFSPIRDESGGVGGLFHPVIELTQHTLSERRLTVLRDLADRAAETDSVAATCAAISQVLAESPLDVPFALLYLLDADGTRATRVAHAGLHADAPAAIPGVDLACPPDPCWPLAEAARGRDPVQWSEVERRFGPLPCDPYPESPHTAFVLPINLSGLEHPFALLVAGASPRRAVDEPYRTFYLMLREAVTTALINARAYEWERRRAEALAEIDHAKTAFFSNVSHEFRTPLTLMLGPLEEVLSRPGSEGSPDRDAIEVSYRNAQRLLKLVNSLLDFSRIEAGRAQAAYAPADLAALTGDLASNFRSACEKAGLRFVVDCATNEPAYVDREMWEKIVLNLLSNAFKFTFEGEIAVHLRETKDEFVLTVRDTGSGIPAAELPRMFERFHRVEGARGRSYEGSGIGLALVQELVKLHGGSIGVKSTLGAGTTFTISIPKGRAHLPAVRAERAGLSTAVRAEAYVDEALSWLPGGKHEDKKRVAGPRVLLADDNADMRDYACRLLAEHYNIEAVADGEAALAAVRARKPDLVIADVMMPRLDGFGLLAAIRSDDALRDIPVVLLSARAGEQSRVEGLRAGAVDYIVKPFGARELIGKIAARLEMRDAAARDAFRVTLTDAMRSLSDSVAIKALASRLLAERLDADRVLYFEVRDSNYFVESDYTRGVPSLAGAYPVDSFGSAILTTLRAARTVVCADVEAEPSLSSAEKAAFRGIQIGAHVGVPLVKDGRFVAGLAVQCTGRRDWLPAEVAMAEECAERTWAAVERAYAERKRRASDERYRKLFESIDEGFCIAQVILDQSGAPCDFRFLEANAAFESHTGLADAVGKTARELVPDLEEFWFRTYGKVALTGESVRFENHAPAMRRSFDVHCSRIGRPEELKVAILFHDITQRKQAEEALRESEARFRALAAMSSDWYWEQDEHFRYVHMSEEVEMRAGMPAPSHIGKTRWELRHAGVSEEQWAEHRALLERHEPFRGFAFQRINEHGDAIWVSASGDPFFDSDGRFKGYRGTGTNITERKQAEQALRKSEERFRTLADHMSQLAWMADEKGWIFWYNRRWYEFTGTTLEDMQGWGWKKVHHPEHVERVVARVQHSWDTGEVWEDTFPLRGRDGHYRWFLSRAVPIRDAANRVLRWFGTNTDVTEQREAEAALKEADQRKDEFIATLSHELRNPLAPLRNGIELLRTHGGDGALAPIREMMERQLNQLVRLVDDLLEISRVSRGAFELRHERVELAVVVTNALETSDPLIKGAQHELSVSLPEKPIWIEGDPVRLAQILTNLLNNATKYTAPGGRINVRAEEQDGMATVSVADNGDGIAADLFPGLFEIFSRGRQPSGRDVGGLGVGLAISRRLAEMHRGTLSVTSEGPGKGSEFTLRLPLAADATAAATRTEPISTAARPQQRILVVDDNHDAAESLRMVLNLLGADVQVANDGPQALDAFEAYHPEVVLLDIGMPGMDGYEVARIIRAKHSKRRPAIVALTGWGQADDRRKSRESGFDHHLVKPADIGALRALLASLPTGPDAGSGLDPRRS